jgi:hypothetical protein
MIQIDWERSARWFANGEQIDGNQAASNRSRDGNFFLNKLLQI